MPNPTIQGGSMCAADGNHCVVQTDLGVLKFLLDDLQQEAQGIDEITRNGGIVFRHLYKAERAGGKTHNQALQALVGKKMYL